jgi:hypothetical protein
VKLDKPQREELRRLAGEATEGPWTAMLRPPKGYGDHGWRAIASWGGWIVGVPRDRFLRVVAGIVNRTEEHNKADMAFIAAARQAVPDLLDTCDALEAEGERREVLPERITETDLVATVCLGSDAETGEAIQLDVLDLRGLVPVAWVGWLAEHDQDSELIEMFTKAGMVVERWYRVRIRPFWDGGDPHVGGYQPYWWLDEVEVIAALPEKGEEAPHA